MEPINPIIAPKDHPLDYFNRKRYHSILLQALVDDEYIFLNVNTEWPGGVHDARMLSNSTLFQRCEAGTFLLKWEVTLGTTRVPLLILGDPAYPLWPWLMKPFSVTGLTPAVSCMEISVKMIGLWKHPLRMHQPLLALLQPEHSHQANRMQ